jgi:hypothetical protein
MNRRKGVLALALAFSFGGLVQATPQNDNRGGRRDNQQEHQGDQNPDRDHHNDESGFYGNANYQRGWKDGQNHKHKNKKWRNDSDRQAYEAGYAHGDQGEKWQNPNQHRDQDNSK